MKTFNLNPLHAAILVSSVTVPAISQAQENIKAQDDNTLRLEEIVVTARRRAETIQDIPVTVTAFSENDLERKNIVNMRDLVDATPGVTYESSGSIATGAISMRGMTQPGNVGFETNVAVFVDGVYQHGRAAAFVPMVGLERVEVVRGPQSASYGRNAFSGAINYVTKKPGDETEASIEGTYGTYDRKGFKGRLSGSLMDNLSASIDFIDDESGSTWKDDNGDRLGSMENTSARARVIFTPTESLEFDLGYTYIDLHEQPQAGFEIDHNGMVQYFKDFTSTRGPSWVTSDSGFVGSLKPQTPDGASSGAFGSEMKSDSYSLTTSVAFANDLELKSITSYTEREIRAITGYDSPTLRNIALYDPFATVGTQGFVVPWSQLGINYITSVAGGTVGIFAGPDGEQVIQTAGPRGQGTFYLLPASYNDLGGQPNTDFEGLSQEFRLSGTASESLTWDVGLLYSKDKLDDWLWVGVYEPQTTLSANALQFLSSPLPITDVNAPPILLETIYETEVKSAFFALSWDVTDKLNIGLEGGYTEEDRSADNTVARRSPTEVPTGYKEGSWEWFSPRVTMVYTPDDYTNLYLNVAEGTKSGGLNGNGAGAEERYDPESNITYEIGAKRTVMDGRGFMNISAYYVDWKDQQIGSFSSVNAPGTFPANIVVNLGKSEIKGFELETGFQISKLTSFHASYTYNEAKIKKGIYSAATGYTDFAALGMNGVPIESLTSGVCSPAMPPFAPQSLPVCGTLVSDGDVSGKYLPNAPKNTVNLGIRYGTELEGINGEFYSAINYIWKDKSYNEVMNVRWIDEHDRIDLQLGLRSNNWYTEINVVNLLDDIDVVAAYRPYKTDGRPQQSVVNGDGRMASLTIGYEF